MVIAVCIGSGCHVRGSRRVIKKIQDYLAEHNRSDSVELEACFCQGHCTEGVVVRFDGELVTHVSANTIEGILEKRLGGGEQGD